MVKRRSALFRRLKKIKFIAEEITEISPHFYKSRQIRIIQRYQVWPFYCLLACQNYPVAGCFMILFANSAGLFIWFFISRPLQDPVVTLYYWCTRVKGIGMLIEKLKNWKNIKGTLRVPESILGCDLMICRWHWLALATQETHPDNSDKVCILA